MYWLLEAALRTGSGFWDDGFDLWGSGLVYWLLEAAFHAISGFWDDGFDL